MLHTFTFTFDDKTGEATYAGTINPRQALALLPDIVIKAAIEEKERKDKETNDTD